MEIFLALHFGWWVRRPNFQDSNGEYKINSREVSSRTTEVFLLNKNIREPRILLFESDVQAC